MIKLIFRIEGCSSIGLSPIKKSGLALINRLGLMKYPNAAKGLCFSQAMSYLAEIHIEFHGWKILQKKAKIYCSRQTDYVQ